MTSCSIRKLKATVWVDTREPAQVRKRLWNMRALLLCGWTALLIGAAACDPGMTLTLQLRNRTSQALRVEVPELVGMYHAPDLEQPGISVVVSPGEWKEARLTLPMGSRAGPVRAYADGRLVFCQEYTFRSQGEWKASYGVDLIVGQVACE